MRQLPGVADGAEHLLGREIEDGQPVEDLAAGDAHTVVAAPAELPGSCGAFFGPHAHRIDQPPAKLWLGAKIAAQFALDRPAFKRARTPPH